MRRANPFIPGALALFLVPALFAATARGQITGVINVRAQPYGAKGDVKRLSDGVSNATTTFTSASAAFAGADALKIFTLRGGASAGLTTQAAGPTVTIRSLSNFPNYNYGLGTQGTDITYSAATISFAPPGTINDGANQLAQFRHNKGAEIMVLNSADRLNDGIYTILIATAGALTVGKAFNTTISSVTNATTVELAAAPVNRETLGVFDYGTDDSAAIQTALDAGATGGIVFFPPGTYYVGTRLTVNENNFLMGSGWGQSILRVSPTIDPNNGEILYNLPPSGGHADKITIRDLELDGNRIAARLASSGGEQSQAGITLNAGHGIEINHVYIHDCVSDGLYMTNGIENVVIANSWIYRNGYWRAGGQAGSRGVVFGIDPRYFRVYANRIEDNTAQGILIQNEGPNGVSEDWEIGPANVITGNNWLAGAAGGIDITDNTMSRVATSNVVLRQFRVIQNIVDGNIGVGIRLSENTSRQPPNRFVGEMDDGVIDGNTIRGATAAAIQIQTTNDGLVRQTVVTRNTINGGATGILVVNPGVSGTVIDGNDIFGLNSGTAIVDKGSATLIGCNVVDEGGHANLRCPGK